MKNRSLRLLTLVVLASRILFFVPSQALAASACRQVETAQVNAATATMTNLSKSVTGGVMAAPATSATNTAAQGCLSSLSSLGGNLAFPSMSGMLSGIENMACSMTTGMASGAVSVLSGPLNSYSAYGLGGNAGFGQSGITTTASGPPSIVSGTVGSILGGASGGVSNVVGGVGSTMTNGAGSLPGANLGTIPGTNGATNGISNSFNNIYKP